MTLRERIAARLTIEPRTSSLPSGRARWKAALGLIVLMVVIGFFLVRAQAATEELVVHWQPLNWSNLVASLLIVLASYFLVGGLWWYLLRVLGGRASLLQALRVYFLSGLPRYIPGWVWGYAGRTYLIEQNGVSRKVAVLSSVVEIGLFVGTGLAIGMFYWLKFSEAVVPALAILAIIIMGLVLLIGMVSHHCCFELRSIISSATLTALYVGFWLVYGTSIVVLVETVSQVSSPQQFVTITSGFSLAWLAGFIAVFVPGGLGVREAGIILLLEPLIGSAPAILISILSRVINLGADALLFVLALTWQSQSTDLTKVSDHKSI